MKKIIQIILFLIANTSIAQSFKIGDNLKEEYNKISQLYYFDAPNFTEFYEGNGMKIIGSKQNPNECESIFLALKDSSIFGVIKLTEPFTFLFDSDGNSTIDLSTEFFILPTWVVKSKTQVVASDKKIYNLLEKFYEKTMQADENEIDETTILEYQSYKSNLKLANRHIALLFDNYQFIINETAVKGINPPSELCLFIIDLLSIECMDLYGKIPTIVCIYKGEALQSAGKIEEARIHFKESLKTYPKSIPLKVYSYRLEEDENLKKKQYDELKKNHPKHWMVKNL